jgi:hypothetical protein
MAKKEKAKKPVAGSPVTIGGGGGIIDTIAFIKFNPKDWDCDCYEGKLTLKGKGVISFAELTKSGSSSTHTGVSKIKIVFA